MSVDERVLTAAHVEEVMTDCVFRDDEWREGEPTPENMVRVEGIVGDYGFHPGRLQEHAEEIRAMLRELPPEFMQSGGGGMSFLNACDDKYGEQWTGLHRTMGFLFGLGMAIGYVDCLFPRDLWSAMPGGVPYYVVKDQA
jgi:hypothetical protein